MKKLLLLVLIAGAVSYVLQSSNVEQVQRSAQAILDRDVVENALAVEVVHTPRSAFVPFVGPSEWRSYIFLAGKNGHALDPQKCPLTTDYELKLSGTNTLVEGGKYGLRVYFKGLQECSDRLKVNG